MAELTPEEQLVVVTESILESVADGIKSVTVDNQTVEAIPLRDRIEAAKFLACQNRRGKPAIRLTRILPPGAV